MQPADSTPSPDKSRQYHRRRIESIERELFGFGITIGTPLAGAEQHTPCHERAQSSGEIGPRERPFLETDGRDGLLPLTDTGGGRLRGAPISGSGLALV